jgi:hypothetical protein
MSIASKIAGLHVIIKTAIMIGYERMDVGKYSWGQGLLDGAWREGSHEVIVLATSARKLNWTATY